MSDIGSEPEPEPQQLYTLAEKFAALAAEREQVAPEIGVANQPWVSPELAFVQVPAKPIRKREVSEEQARSLAMTRRKRFSEFWGGAMIASAPGTWGTLSEIDTNNLRLPSSGHIFEVAICLVTTALFLTSLLDFNQPTSREELAELFPEVAKRASLGVRVGLFFADIQRAFRSLQ